MNIQNDKIFPSSYLGASHDCKLEIKQRSKDLLAYYIRLALEKEPVLSSLQTKAKGVQKFLNDAGVNVLCVDSYNSKSSGISILESETQNEIFFIKTNSVLINVLYDLYFSGAFSTCGGPKIENDQNSFLF